MSQDFKKSSRIQFIILINKKKDGRAAVCVWIIADSQRVDISLKRYVKPTERDAFRRDRKEMIRLSV
jgi:hypothetical protein